MSFSGLRVARIAVIFFAFLGLACIKTAHAQDATQEPAAAEAPTAQDGDVQSADATDPDEINRIRAGFDTLRLMAYVAFAVGLIGGLVVYWCRRSSLRSLSRTLGAATAVALAMLTFAALIYSISTPETSRCSSAVLREGENATEYDDICRESRETSANAFGGSWAFRQTFVREGQSYIVPMGAGAVRFATWFSEVLVTLLAYVALQPLVRRMLIGI